MEKRCSNCAYYNERSDGPHCGGCFISEHSNWEKLLPPLQPKFKVGDKVIFTSRLNEDNTKGIITKVFEKGSVAIRNGDYVVKEYDSNYFWEVWENDITGIWDESPSLPSPDFFDYFRYFPKFSLPIFKNDAILRIDTDSIKVKKEDKKMKDRPRDHKFVKSIFKERRIKEVMFNGPATIIKWEPLPYDVFVNGNTKGDKTVSVCSEGDIYDKEKGFLLAVIKEFVDNQSYDNILRMMDSFNDKESEIHLNFTEEEMAKEFLDDVKVVKDLLPKDLSRIYTDNDVIAEFEKTKAEINSEDVSCRYDEFAYSSGLQKTIEIIDKRISELKGDQSDN